MLQQEYEAFQIELGLYGDILSYSWKDMGCLATRNTWFENLWQLCEHFGLKVHTQREAWLGPVRDGDVALMLAFWDLGYRGTDLKRLNRVRKFLCVLHKSDLCLCDGRTVMTDVFNRVEGESARHRFPIEQPEGRDFNLWKTAVGQLLRENF